MHLPPLNQLTSTAISYIFFFILQVFKCYIENAISYSVVQGQSHVLRVMWHWLSQFREGDLDVRVDLFETVVEPLLDVWFLGILNNGDLPGREQWPWSTWTCNVPHRTCCALHSHLLWSWKLWTAHFSLKITACVLLIRLRYSSGYRPALTLLYLVIGDLL